jgi:transposase
MALGRRGGERQQEMWVATQDLAAAPRHVFYDRLNKILADARFDKWVEDLCEEFYAGQGRPSIPPGVFFRMLFVGYFEGIDSQRGIAWRCADSLSLRKFLGYTPQEETPDHSSLSRIRWRLPQEVFHDVFQFVLSILNAHKLIDAKTVGVDSTMLEANAAMKSIVRRDNGEDWEEYVKRLATEDGVEIRTKADLIRYDKDRDKKGKKKVSNDEWVSPADPDSRIARMKNGTTHLAYKAEHVVDLKTEAILAAEIYHANQADTATLTESLSKAQDNLEEAHIYQDIEKAVADKGYHAAETLVGSEEVGSFGVKTYIPEPDSKWQRVWTDKPFGHQRAVYNNRRRTGRDFGKKLQRRRSEVVERSFAHTCETGGARRSWLRQRENVGKRYLMQAAAHNLGLVLRKLLGAGKPREFWAVCGVHVALWSTLWTHRRALRMSATRKINLWYHSARFGLSIRATPAAPAAARRFTHCSTGCYLTSTALTRSIDNFDCTLGEPGLQRLQFCFVHALT